MTDVAVSPRDRSSRKSRWEGGQEHWPVHISAALCLLTDRDGTEHLSRATLQHSVSAAATSARRLWSHTDRLPLCLAEPRFPHLPNAHGKEKRG